jgi:hypothetical protein
MWKVEIHFSKQEEEAVLNLSKEKNIKILKADKGNVTVVMDKEEYEEKLEVMVMTQDYRKLKGDPTSKIEQSSKVFDGL